MKWFLLENDVNGPEKSNIRDMTHEAFGAFSLNR